MVFFQIYRSYRRNILLSVISYGNPLNNEWYQPAQHVQDDLSRHPATTIMYIPCRAYHLLGLDKKSIMGLSRIMQNGARKGKQRKFWRECALHFSPTQYHSAPDRELEISVQWRAEHANTSGQNLKYTFCPLFFMTRLYWSMLFHDPYTLIIHIHLTTDLTRVMIKPLIQFSFVHWIIIFQWTALNGW